MRKITAEELKEILRRHELWLNDDPRGEKADFSRVDLRYANLYEADLSGTNLYVADLRGANLSGADLYRADLRGADLYGANLSRADLSGTNLYEADLSRADLSGANLSRADLSRANLSGAKLSRADLSGTNLYEADLYEADLYEAKIDYPMVCPEKGSFTGYKKCKNGLIVELEIPEDALRSSATTRKCRCSKAKVISITNLDGSKSEEKKAISNRDSSFVYKLGETVEVPDFDPIRWNECSTGIHFFMARKEAVDYGI